ncbi:hypothetical protein NPIL_179271 [Nephila pilipes]|uniref:Uncharacterized protein n=1 Tax=Nephila pilipes TaxID=299642 RepID=A0A8X6NC88_NEPPI|nr:hypothetical protein NPIL_179271 [Nephila pilipes]
MTTETLNAERARTSLIFASIYGAGVLDYSPRAAAAASTLVGASPSPLAPSRCIRWGTSAIFSPVRGLSTDTSFIPVADFMKEKRSDRGPPLQNLKPPSLSTLVKGNAFSYTLFTVFLGGDCAKTRERGLQRGGGKTSTNTREEERARGRWGWKEGVFDPADGNLGQSPPSVAAGSQNVYLP